MKLIDNIFSFLFEKEIFNSIYFNNYLVVVFQFENTFFEIKIEMCYSNNTKQKGTEKKITN